jgi:hypothetical protein
MDEERDPLAKEISIVASLEETGLTVKAKSRALAALDRLIGSALDIPAAWLESISRRKRQEENINERLVEEDAQAAIYLLRDQRDVGARTIQRFAEDQTRKQRNREAVAAGAVEELRSLPAGTSETGTTAAEDEPINEDWLNIFSAHAENASSEHLRGLWARILAGEIRQPGSFSLTTLRTIAELDKDIATMFQAKLAHRLRAGFLPKPAGLAGQELLDFIFLEEVGLLQDVSVDAGSDLQTNADGYKYATNGDHFLKIKAPLAVRVPLIRITRVGREIASILPQEPDDIALRTVAELLLPNVEQMELCRITPQTSDGNVTSTIVHKFK